MRLLRWSFVLVVACAAALAMALPHTGADATVRIVQSKGHFVFVPEITRIEPGQRVAFVNETNQTHTAACLDCPWDTGDIQPGQTKFMEFPETFSYPYGCRYHQELGRIIVGNAEPSPSPSPSPAP